MDIKQSIVTTLSTLLLLTACNHLPDTHNTQVDHRSLIHSMTYTHRHLAEQHLNQQAPSPLFTQSHCDLIDRGIVHSKTTPKACTHTNKTTQACIAAFHRCICQCPTFKRECQPCEQQAQQCLTNQTEHKD